VQAFGRRSVRTRSHRFSLPANAAASRSTFHPPHSATAPPPKRRKIIHTLHTSIVAPQRLTEETLLRLDEQYSYEDASFDGDVKTRALQEAGRQMGFHLKLDCYEQAASSLVDWLDAYATLSKERPVFKDKEDVRAVEAIAKVFGVGIANASNVQCEA
jgi:hypothetical protein